VGNIEERIGGTTRILPVRPSLAQDIIEEFETTAFLVITLIALTFSTS